jgi:site-specific DNA recombinase
LYTSRLRLAVVRLRDSQTGSSDGYATKDPDVFDKLKAAGELMATGTKSLHDVADHLNKQGVTEKTRGIHRKKLRAQALSRIFRNKFYAGKVISKRYSEEVDGQHPPMVTEETLYRVQAVIDGRNKNFVPEKMARRNPNNEDFPLRRIIKCGKCGYSFTGGWSRGKRKRYAYYVCSKRCKGSSAPAGVARDVVMELLNALSLKPQTAELFSAYLRKTYHDRISTLQRRRDAADDELKKTYELRQALIQKHLAGVYADDVFKEQNQLLNEKINTIQIAKSDEVLEQYNLEAITEFVEDKFTNLPKTFEDSELLQKKTLMCSIFPSGVH